MGRSTRPVLYKSGTANLPLFPDFLVKSMMKVSLLFCYANSIKFKHMTYEIMAGDSLSSLIGIQSDVLTP